MFTGGANSHYAEHVEELRALVCRGDAVVLMRGPSVSGVADEADLGLAPVTTAGSDVLLGCPLT